MFRLIRLTRALISICTLAIFAAHLVGRTQPSPLAALFTNPDGTPCERPCLFGIHPGKMSVDEAVAVLKNHRLLNNVRRLDDPNYAFPVGAYSNDLFPGKQLLIYVEPGPGDQNPIMATGVELVLIESDEDAMSHIDQPIMPLGTFIDFAGEPEATSLSQPHRFTIYLAHESSECVLYAKV
ncbi:MAG: hypothetical protein IT324_13205 [Anaerolineae bacterium]|nr:hypothetical protein [Anaerolineae bacterium]